MYDARLLFFTFVLAVPAANAQAPHDEIDELGTIQVTATRRAESTLDVPTGVTVVDEAQVREAFAPTAMDLLHGEVGTFVQQTTPGQSIVIVRGLKGSEVLHLVDGFRLNNAIFRNSPNQYMALVDGQAIERVEVVRGPMSTLYGGDAMGGVVQLFSVEPEFTGADWQASGRVRAVFASADDSILTRAEASGGREGLALTGGVSYQDVDELRVGGGDTLPFTAFRARAGNLKAIWSPTAGHELMLQAQALKQPSTPRFDELFPGFGQTRANSSEFAFEPQTREFLQGRWRMSNPTPAFDSLELMAGHQVIRDDRRNRDFGTLNRDTERNDVDTLGVGVVAEKTLSASQHMAYGAEYYRDDVSSSRQRTNINTGAVSARASRFPNGSTMRQFGVFATHDWQIA
ncbi:MAG: TonB-dependent receptor plug domain-containing protein, partial [Lysobacterales bacterium]